MSLKRGKQLNEYLKTINFGLLDYKKTNEKYKNYKTERWNHIKNLAQLNMSLNFGVYLGELNYRGAMGCYIPNTLTKSSIRMLKTRINAIIYQMNLERITRGNFRLNQNEKRCFTIRFYLDNYKTINSLMKKVLVYYVKRFFN